MNEVTPNPRGGPRTPEGKNRSRFNAVRHGLTGQTSVFPWEDTPLYDLLGRQMMEHYKPVGPMEEHLVQTMIDAIWKLKRASVSESGLFALHVRNHDGVLTENDPQVDSGLIKGLLFSNESRKLDNISRYAGRAERTVYRAEEKLQELQTRRKQQEEEALAEAAALKKAHEKRPENNNMAYNPETDGFVLTTEQIDAWIALQERRRKAGLSSKTAPPAPNGNEKRAA